MFDYFFSTVSSMFVLSPAFKKLAESDLHLPVPIAKIMVGK